MRSSVLVWCVLVWWWCLVWCVLRCATQGHQTTTHPWLLLRGHHQSPWSVVGDPRSLESGSGLAPRLIDPAALERTAWVRSTGQQRHDDGRGASGRPGEIQTLPHGRDNRTGKWGGDGGMALVFDYLRTANGLMWDKNIDVSDFGT